MHGSIGPAIPATMNSPGNDINRILTSKNDGFEVHIMYFNLKKET